MTTESTTRRAITIAGGRRIGLGVYVRGVQVAKANPDETFKEGLTTWASCTGRQIVEQFREGMVDRLNQAIPHMLRGLPGAPAPRRVPEMRGVHRNQAVARYRRRVGCPGCGGHKGVRDKAPLPRLERSGVVEYCDDCDRDW